MADGEGHDELSESMLAALAADDRLLQENERTLLRSIVARLLAEHGATAARSAVDAAGRVIGERLTEQLGRAVAERVVEQSLEPDPELVPVHPVDPPPSIPPVFPDPAPPNPPHPPIPAPPNPYPGPAPFEPPGPYPIPPYPAPAPWPMPPFSTPQDLPGEVGPPQDNWLGLENAPGELTIPVHFTVLRELLGEQEIAETHAWARDHQDRFVEETVVAATGEPVETAQTVRVLDDLGDLGARIAARTLERLPATRAYVQAAESVSLRLVEARPGTAIDVRPPLPVADWDSCCSSGPPTPRWSTSTRGARRPVSRLAGQRRPPRSRSPPRRTPRSYSLPR
ncbi:hypothetical protein GCM10027615_64650 [Plantactinospora veratri]